MIDVPTPALAPEGVLIDVRASVLSAGTERTKVQAGRKSLVGKARSRPDQVALVVDKARRDGIRDTFSAVRMRLDEPSPLGYSAAGVVLEVGRLVSDISPGDRVACGGAGAAHAEVDHVPGNLCVRLPEAVDFAQGAFATLGAIAMHGVRQADVRLGERVAVIGQGLVGQLSGMILRAAGCEVVGIDLDGALLERARANGAVDVAMTRAALDADALPDEAAGCDAVILTAATESDDPVRLAAALCRDRGRVVVVGAVGLQVPRAPYYDKELDLRLSRSYGPGRYDRAYEERGLDYPIGYVRWTERRNMEAFLALIAAGRLGVAGLISERRQVEETPEAYERLASDESSPLGILIEYPATSADSSTPVGAPAPHVVRVAGGRRAGLIGAGSFARRVLLPALDAAGFELAVVASATGLSAHAAAESMPGARVGDVQDVIGDPETELVAIATRHSTHAMLAVDAMRAGKAVYVEKPPCLTWDELADLDQARREERALLAVGFNRRHAPLAEQMRDHVAGRGHPIEILIRVNAGSLPPSSWINDPADGGGRLLSEGCHFVDLACWVVGSPADRVACMVAPQTGETLQTTQRFHISLTWANGSVAGILYGSEGAAGVAKELVEVHSGGRSALLDDFRRLDLYDGRKRSRTRPSRQDKGHRQQIVRLREQLAGAAGEHLDPLATMAVSLAALDAAADGAERPAAASTIGGHGYSPAPLHEADGGPHDAPPEP